MFTLLDIDTALDRIQSLIDFPPRRRSFSIQEFKELDILS